MGALGKMELYTEQHNQEQQEVCAAITVSPRDPPAKRSKGKFRE